MANLIFFVDLVVFAMVITCAASLLQDDSKRRRGLSSQRCCSYACKAERNIRGTQCGSIGGRRKSITCRIPDVASPRTQCQTNKER